MAPLTAPAIVIPSWDGWPELARCLDALPARWRRQVIVVDNGSRDDTAAKTGECYPEVTVIALAKNTGFAHAVNVGIRAAAGRDVVVLNNDTVPAPDWMDELLAAAGAAGPRVGFVASKLLRLGTREIDSAGDLPTWAGLPVQRGHGEIDAGQWDDSPEVPSGCGGATWLRREMLAEIGLFAEEFFAYLEDVDLCLRAQLHGWSGRFAPRAVVFHATSATSGRVSGFKMAQTARNSWWLLARTTPAPLLPRILPRFLALHLLLLVSSAFKGELRPVLRGHAAGLRGVGAALRQRRQIMAGSVLDAEAFAALLVPRPLSAQLRAGLRALMWRLVRQVPPPAYDPGDPAGNADAALRYRQVAQLLLPTAERVLEVGSGSLGITPFRAVPFLVGVDADFAATQELVTAELHKVTASAVELPFPDASFDAAISVDALEHIPATARPAAIAEMLRVTRPGGTVILAAPFGRLSQLADRYVDGAFRRRHGRAHPWLVEHLANGLPCRVELAAALGAQRASVRVHRNAAIPLWVALQLVSIGAHGATNRPRLLAELAARLPAWPAYRLIYEIRK